MSHFGTSNISKEIEVGAVYRQISDGWIYGAGATLRDYVSWSNNKTLMPRIFTEIGTSQTLLTINYYIGKNKTKYGFRPINQDTLEEIISHPTHGWDVIGSRQINKHITLNAGYYQHKTKNNAPEDRNLQYLASRPRLLPRV